MAEALEQGGLLRLDSDEVALQAMRVMWLTPPVAECVINIRGIRNNISPAEFAARLTFKPQALTQAFVLPDWSNV